VSLIWPEPAACHWGGPPRLRQAQCHQAPADGVSAQKGRASATQGRHFRRTAGCLARDRRDSCRNPPAPDLLGGSQCNTPPVPVVAARVTQQDVPIYLAESVWNTDPVLRTFCAWWRSAHV
jgi:hypothetical protein